MNSIALKLREFYKNDLVETFVDDRLHLPGFLLNFEKSATSILEMSDVMD
jgi:hypothetical protein